ncbi:MAG: glycosyltransferase family 4 protein [Thermodesulfovibrionales bacterium]
MRIAIVRKKYVFHGGAEGFSQSLVQRLAAAGHEVHIYAIGWSGEAGQKGVTMHRVPVLGATSLLRDLSFALVSARLLKKDRTRLDIIQSHDKTLFQDVYRAGDGCHIEWLGQRWKRAGLPEKLSIGLNPYHWMILLLERTIFRSRKYRRIIAISELVKRNIMEHYDVPEADIDVVYNGVDLVKYRPENRDLYRAELRRQYGIPDDAFVILFVGSGFERKGVGTLIRAAELLDRPVTVLIAGRGRDGRYRKLARRQRVVFCGPQKQIERYYAAADLFVFPTIYEPFGNVHLEALASGLPVITTRSSGAAEIIRDGVQGFAVSDSDDAAAVASSIAVFFDRGVRERAGREARKLAEEFGFERYVKTVTALYEAVLAERRTGG